MDNYILVVDDNPSDLILTSAYVEKEGYVAIQACDAYEALGKLDEFDYRILIVDLQMPRMNGIDLIKRIRRIQKFKHTPILVTSARKEARDVKQAVLAGAKDYIVKPIDGAVFEEKLSRMAGRKPLWVEYAVNSSHESSEGYIRRSMKILSLNEVGMTILYIDPLPVDESLEVGGELLGGGGAVQGKVDECVKIHAGYKIKLSFVGMTEETRKKIRLVCRSLWVESQNIKPNAA